MLAQSFFFGDIEWEKSFAIILYEFFVLIDNFYVTLMSSQCGSVYQAAYGSAWASYGLLQFPTRRASQKFLTSNFITKISHVHFFLWPLFCYQSGTQWHKLHKLSPQAFGCEWDVHKHLGTLECWVWLPNCKVWTSCLSTVSTKTLSARSEASRSIMLGQAALIPGVTRVSKSAR